MSTKGHSSGASQPADTSSRAAKGTEKSPGAEVLLCQKLESLGNGLELAELCRWLNKTHPGVATRVVPALCHAPGGLFGPTTARTERVVLGLCSQEYAEVELQSQARKAGLDPVGFEIANLGGFCAFVQDGSQRIEKAKLMLAAAVARARAYSGSSPENLKSRLAPLSQKMSRRALFTIPPVQYRVVASIDSTRCVADAGCHLCVQLCPTGALRRSDDKVYPIRSLCNGCGICVTACPRGAVQLPGSSQAQFESQIAAPLEAGAGLSGYRILFACKGAAGAIEEAGRQGVGASPSWLPVPVPCAGMVPVGWILQCVARGIRIGITPCRDGCVPKQKQAIKGRVDYCQQLLSLLGGSPEQVRVVDPEEGPGSEDHPHGIEDSTGSERGAREHGPIVLGSAALADALRLLAKRYVLPEIPVLEHLFSPVGVVSVDPQRCTGCGVCAETCPTGALKLQRNDEGVEITFDAGSCTACDQCTGVCPEADGGAIRLRRVTDFALLALGRQTLHEDKQARCEVCGAPIATQGMLNRIAALLGEEEAALADKLARYCTTCRITR